MALVFLRFGLCLFHFKDVSEGGGKMDNCLSHSRIFTSPKGGAEGKIFNCTSVKNSVWLTTLDKIWPSVWGCNPRFPWAYVCGRFWSCFCQRALWRNVSFSPWPLLEPACLPAWDALQLSRRLKSCREEFTPIWGKLTVLCSKSGWLLQC